MRRYFCLWFLIRIILLYIAYLEISINTSKGQFRLYLVFYCRFCRGAQFSETIPARSCSFCFLYLCCIIHDVKLGMIKHKYNSLVCKLGVSRFHNNWAHIRENQRYLPHDLGKRYDLMMGWR